MRSSRDRWSAWVASASLCGALALPAPALCDEPVPVVPRFQGPPSQTTFDPGQEIWGIALVATGALAGGLGLFALERSDLGCEGGPECEEGAEAELGTGLLIGGVFIAGIGLYLIATSGERPPRIVVERSLGLLARTPVDVRAVDGGGLIGSSFSF